MYKLVILKVNIYLYYLLNKSKKKFQKNSKKNSKKKFQKNSKKNSTHARVCGCCLLAIFLTLIARGQEKSKNTFSTFRQHFSTGFDNIFRHFDNIFRHFDKFRQISTNFDWFRQHFSTLHKFYIFLQILRASGSAGSVEYIRTYKI